MIKMFLRTIIGCIPKLMQKIIIFNLRVKFCVQNDYTTTIMSY